MKADIHPEYAETKVTCSCGNTFTTRSTIASGELHAELCNECHPFFTGKQKLVDSGGRVERFKRRYGRTSFTSGDGETKAGEPKAKAEKTAAPKAEAPAAADEPEASVEPAEDTAAADA